jgi:hypothetical protein
MTRDAPLAIGIGAAKLIMRRWRRKKITKVVSPIASNLSEKSAMVKICRRHHRPGGVLLPRFGLFPVIPLSGRLAVAL